MIICQHCQAQTDDGAIFCDVCGHELAPLPQHNGQTPHPPLGAQRPSAPPAPVPPQPSRQRVTSAPYDATGAARAAAVPSGPPPTAIVLRMKNGQRFTLKGKTDYTIGRLGDGHPLPDLDLANYYGFEAGVSRDHFMIHVSPDGVFVEDLESQNYTIHNGYRLHPLQWYPLHEGDELRAGAIVFYVSFER